MHSYNHSASWTPQNNSIQNQEQRQHTPPSFHRHVSVPAPQPTSMQRSPSASVLSSPHHPSLTPGRNRHNTYFAPSSATPYNITSPTIANDLSSPASFYADYFYTQQNYPISPPPPIPAKPQSFLPSPPPIPPKLPTSPFLLPKLPFYPQSIPGPIAGPANRRHHHHHPSDDGDIALAIALSTSEASTRQEQMIAQEEEDLAMALEMSRLYASEHPYRSSPPVDITPPQSCRTSANPKALHLSPIIAPSQPLDGESWLQLETPPDVSHFDDQQAQTAEFGVRDEIAYPEASPILLEDRGDTPTPAGLTFYNAVVSTALQHRCSTSSKASKASKASAASTPAGPNEPSRPALRTVVSYGDFKSNRTPREPPLSSRPKIGTTDGTSPLSSTADSAIWSPLNAPASPPSSLNSSKALDPLDEDFDEEEDRVGMADKPPPNLGANQYVEPDLLMGISLGFTPPAISTILSPLQGAMPNVITLPYGKYPSLHLQAPSWRQMLKLMARLSGSRIEPTLEALAIAKHELNLRIVVQFVKVHHSSSEWRTVLYLTTEFPCPSNVPNGHRYTNGDVSVLPYSYTLSSRPTLLRDCSESLMAKYYVIPATKSTPYPTLPITFPNLAMYLQSAVQDSRRAANDSSSGMRKLAQYIDTCYPDDSEPCALDDAVVTRKGVGGMLKRVIGRNKQPKGRGGNEEIYELVTPFVPEEWG